MSNTIIIDNVSYSYFQKGKEIVKALKRINLHIKEGEMFSIVGPDGAGKTTLIRLICGILKPNEGKISVLGMDTVKEIEKIKPYIGYLSQKFSLYMDLTVDENIDFFAEIHRIKNFQSRKNKLLEFTRLLPFRNRLARDLSGGMKQKLALACLLIHQPKIILLDEPTTGVDPVSRRDFWKILMDLIKERITIVVTTPYLDEAERCNSVAMINDGIIFLNDTPENIRKNFEYKVIEIICSPLRNAWCILRNSYQNLEAHLFGDKIHLLLKKDVGEEEILYLLKQNNIEIVNYRFLQPSLEDIFIAQVKAK